MYGWFGAWDERDGRADGRRLLLLPSRARRGAPDDGVWDLVRVLPSRERSEEADLRLTVSCFDFLP